MRKNKLCEKLEIKKLKMILIKKSSKQENYYFTFSNQKFDYQKLIDAIEYLNHFVKDETKRILTDENAYQALIFISNSFIYFSKEINYEIFLSNNFDETFSNILMLMYDKRYEFDLNSQERKAHLFSNLLFVINDLLLHSIKYCHLFVKNTGLNACLLFLGDERFLKTNLNAQLKLFDSDLLPVSPMDHLTMIITNLVMTCDEYKHKWSSLNSVEILLNVARLKQSTQFNVYTTIPFIVNDKQIEKLNVEFEEIIDVLLKVIERAARKDFESDSFHRRTFQIVLKNRAQDFSIHFVSIENGTEISVDYLLDCLFKLVAVNDRVKEEVYFRGEAWRSFKIILEKGKEKKFYVKYKY